MTMSAPDDKISSNRRRLFKALSTAPVVMTLKPGAALANASAYQCAVKLRDIQPAPYNALLADAAEPYSCAEGEICVVEGIYYKKLFYYDPALVSATDRECGKGFDKTVVRMKFGDYRDLAEGKRVGRAAETGDVDSKGRPLLGIYKNRDKDELCFEIPPQEGLFLYAGHTENNDSDWVGKGFFPEHRIEFGNGNQVMSESCWNSFMAGTKFTGG